MRRYKQKTRQVAGVVRILVAENLVDETFNSTI